MLTYILMMIVIILTLSPDFMIAEEIISNKKNCSSPPDISMRSFSDNIIPEMDGKYKGQAGKICVIGSSIEYTGAPYFTAMASLKVGADLVYVITTESAAPVIKSYSPELIVYPFLNEKHKEEIKGLLAKMDVVVIGPVLGRENTTMALIYEVFEYCRVLKLPLVVDADGLYAISKNISIIQEYPKPGAILTPNHKEAKHLEESSKQANVCDWTRAWGKYVSVLIKGKDDVFHSYFSKGWKISTGGSGRRAGGQGDILAGFIATFYSWALKSNLCTNDTESSELAHSLPAYAGSYLTRLCNFKAFETYGRSLTASDMLNKIHEAFSMYDKYKGESGHVLPL